MLRLKSFKLILIICIFVPAILKAQDNKPLSDKSLLLKTSFSYPSSNQKAASFLLVRSANPVIRYNPVSLGFGAAMYIYQNVFSRQFSATCLYSPSCSGFSKQLIKEYGLLKGIFLTTDRISRCNRISATDIHPADFDPKSHKVIENTDIYSTH